MRLYPGIIGIAAALSQTIAALEPIEGASPPGPGKQSLSSTSGRGSKPVPGGGKRECERRQRQLAKVARAALTAAGETR